MLNISKKNPIEENIDQFSTVKNLANRPHYKILNKIIIYVSLIGLVILFLPWTQNISGSGAVTTLKPDQRPQTIHSAIAGRIEKWYVNEGDYVNKGDTILFISEIKEDYIDPNLIKNIKNQVEAKKMAMSSYDGKVDVLRSQIDAIESEKKLKLEQAKNKIRQSLLKVKSDSMDLEAVKTQIKIATTQFNRSVTLNKEGLKLEGEKIYVAELTSTDDIDIISGVEGILTINGGKTSHAAIVSRSWGKVCVVGCEAISIDGSKITIGNKTIEEGDSVLIDGDTGEIYLKK